MTCIVGIAQNNRVYLGGDSSGTNDAGQQVIRADGKVFLISSSDRAFHCVVGGTTSFRMLQLLHYALVLPDCTEEEDLFRYMATRFINAVRACLGDGGYAMKKDEQESGGKFLVGVRGRLFCIDHDYQVRETVIGYDAVGSGDDLALGVLFATQQRDLSPEERIRLALEAATYHNAYVRPPFQIESL